MITFEQIKNSNPLLIIYPGGAGGEYVATTISKASPSFFALSSTRNSITNRTEVESPIHSSFLWEDHDDPNTWVNKYFHYEDNNTNLRYVSRLHPDVNIPALHKHLPDAEILYMSPLAESVYFSKLFFCKTSYKLTLPIDMFLLQTLIGNLVTGDNLNKLCNWINSSPVSWTHDLGYICWCLNNGKDITNIKSDTNPYDNIMKNSYGIHKSYYETCQWLETEFKSFKFINSDSLATDGIKFWNEVKSFIPDLDLDFVLSDTREWISKNNKLIEKFDNDNL